MGWAWEWGPTHSFDHWTCICRQRSIGLAMAPKPPRVAHTTRSAVLAGNPSSVWRSGLSSQGSGVQGRQWSPHLGPHLGMDGIHRWNLSHCDIGRVNTLPNVPLRWGQIADCEVRVEQHAALVGSDMGGICWERCIYREPLWQPLGVLLPGKQVLGYLLEQKRWWCPWWVVTWLWSCGVLYLAQSDFRIPALRSETLWNINRRRLVPLHKYNTSRDWTPEGRGDIAEGRQGVPMRQWFFWWSVHAPPPPLVRSWKEWDSEMGTTNCLALMCCRHLRLHRQRDHLHIINTSSIPNVRNDSPNSSSSSSSSSGPTAASLSIKSCRVNSGMVRLWPGQNQIHSTFKPSGNVCTHRPCGLHVEKYVPYANTSTPQWLPHSASVH